MTVVRGLFNVPAPDVDGVQRLLFQCPGCKNIHGPALNGPKAWQFNGDYDKPVFSPSLLVTWPEYKPEAQERDRLHYAQHGHYPDRSEPSPDDWDQRICHSFIGCNGAQPGQIIFLADCTHALANQVVDIPPFRWSDE